MPTANIGDAELYYEIHGEGAPLLLVAGLGGAGSYWDLNLPWFSQRRQVILHDHRGTGRSSRSEIKYSVEQMTEDLVRLMDAIGLEKADLLGHSTGGAIGMVMAARYPERLGKLVIYASWTEADNHMRLCFDIRKAMLKHEGAAGYCKATPLFLYPPWFIRDREEELARESELAVNGFTTPSIAEARMNAVLAFTARPYLDRIQCPTLILVAEDDMLTPRYYSDELHRRIAGSELCVLPRGGHACSRTVAEEFHAAVVGFVGVGW